MAVNDRSYIRSTCITDFDIVPIEQFSEFMVWREVFTNQLKKTFPDIRRYYFTVRWVEPYDVPCSILLCLIRYLGRSILSWSW